MSRKRHFQTDEVDEDYDCDVDAVNIETGNTNVGAEIDVEEEHNIDDHHHQSRDEHSDLAECADIDDNTKEKYDNDDNRSIIREEDDDSRSVTREDSRSIIREDNDDSRSVTREEDDDSKSVTREKDDRIDIDESKHITRKSNKRKRSDDGRDCYKTTPDEKLEKAQKTLQILHDSKGGLEDQLEVNLEEIRNVAEKIQLLECKIEKLVAEHAANECRDRMKEEILFIKEQRNKVEDKVNLYKKKISDKIKKLEKCKREFLGNKDDSV